MKNKKFLYKFLPFLLIFCLIFPINVFASSYNKLSTVSSTNYVGFSYGTGSDGYEDWYHLNPNDMRIAFSDNTHTQSQVLQINIATIIENVTFEEGDHITVVLNSYANSRYVDFDEIIFYGSCGRNDTDFIDGSFDRSTGYFTFEFDATFDMNRDDLEVSFSFLDPQYTSNPSIPSSNPYFRITDIYIDVESNRRSFFSGVLEWFNDIQLDFGDWFHDLGVSLSNIGTYINTFRSNLLENLYTWFGNVTSGLSNFHISVNGYLFSLINDLTLWFDDLGDWITGLGSTIGGFFTTLTTNLTNWFNSVGQWFLNLGTTIGGFFTTLTTNLTNWFASVGQWFLDLASSIGGFFSNLLSNLGTWFGNVLTWFTTLGDRIGGFFTNLWNNILTKIAAIKTYFEGLFVPDPDFFPAYKLRWDSFISSHMGFLYQSYMLTSDIFTTLRNSINNASGYAAFYIPDIYLPASLGGGHSRLIFPETVVVLEDVFDFEGASIIMMLWDVSVTAIFYLGLLRFGKRTLEEILEMRSSE